MVRLQATCSLCQRMHSSSSTRFIILLSQARHSLVIAEPHMSETLRITCIYIFASGNYCCCNVPSWRWQHGFIYSSSITNSISLAKIRFLTNNVLFICTCKNKENSVATRQSSCQWIFSKLGERQSGFAEFALARKMTGYS